IRSTHLSGLFTDLGILAGQALRGLPTDARRWKLCAYIIGGFLSGAVAGAVCFRAFGYGVLWIPALVTGFAGGWILFRGRGAGPGKSGVVLPEK
ncbi:MAG: hypothetical protein JWL81_844, partial [Verrucomicrobiales bacterium]|nr:hypothetical protein [Verrucomicrobiales bacterium]